MDWAARATLGVGMVVGSIWTMTQMIPHDSPYYVLAWTALWIVLLAGVVVIFWPQLRSVRWFADAKPPFNALANEFERQAERDRARKIDTEPLQWDDHFGIEYSAQSNGQVFMSTFIVNGTNRSEREVAVDDLYFVSGTTGKRLDLVVCAGPNDGFLHPRDINPVPPGATLTARAEFNNPVGLLPKELVDQWGEILFYAVYEGKKHLKTFDRKAVEATFANFRPKPALGPRVTKRDA